ncbi:hypothetical protein PT283_10225, partial [Acetobacteraceae bacterium ESL0697]|nr:hypothetical protein [Acetobacteraceae bacterium ESL0697]
QAETARAQAAEANLVSGTQSLDDYSLKITGIKSQYRDKGKTQPSGIEYIDSNGLYQMAITKDYADTLYAGIPSLQAETTRAQSAEAGLLPKTGGTISGDLFVSGNVSAGTITGTSDALDIIYGDGNRLSLQNDGNFVGYDKNRKILYALNAGGGTVGGKAIATTDDVQAETARAQ